MRDLGERMTEQRSHKRRLKNVIGDLEQRVAAISSVVDTEQRRNAEARLEARLLEALLTARLALKHMIESIGAAAGQGDAAGGVGAAAPPGAAPMPPGLPHARAAPAPRHSLLPWPVGDSRGAAAAPGLASAAAALPSCHPPPSVPATAMQTGASGSAAELSPAPRGVGCGGAAATACCSGDLTTAPRPADSARTLSPLLQRLEAAMDGLIDDVHTAEKQGAGGSSPPPPLAHRVRATTMLQNSLAVRQRRFANGRDLYVWWLQRMAEASSALLDAGAAAAAKPVGWGGGGGRCCASSGGDSGSNRAGNSSGVSGGDSGGNSHVNSTGGTAAVNTRLVELVHITVPQLIGHFTFCPETPGLLELLASNLETLQPGGALDEIWAAWLEAMGLSEQQEFLLLRLRDIFESHMGYLQSQKQHLMGLVASQAARDVTEQSDTVNALDAANFEIAVCAGSSVMVALGAVLTPWQVLRMYTAAAPQWLPGPTGLFDAVARRAARRRQQQQC